MNFYVVTIFPDIFKSFLETSLIKKALNQNLINVPIVNLRDFASPPHYKVDDTPYGGGAGMVLMPEPLKKAVVYIKKDNPNVKVVYLSPKGQLLKQNLVKQLAQHKDYILICGRYEGVDQRFIDKYVDYEISIGEYVLMGGEVPAMVFIEALSRYQPGVIGNKESLKEESFEDGLLEFPHYTKPKLFEGEEVPKVLLSGNHQLINQWRKKHKKKA